MSFPNIKKGFAFSRNPIIFRGSWPPQAYDAWGGRFTLTMDGNNIYSGRFSVPFKNREPQPVDIDISEILDAHIEFFRVPNENNTNPIVELYDRDEINTFFRCSGEFEYDHVSDYGSVIVIPGGVSKQNYKRLLSLKEDAFSTRFLNPANNFFMTTRTAGWRIILKETEIFPLYFLIDTMEETISITEAVSKTSLSFRVTTCPGVYALDINALRDQFVAQNDVLPSVFDIYRGSAFSCRIVVERSDISKERYRLKFRNSLGVFEIIELTGELSINPDYSDSGESSFMRYDESTGGYYSERERVERKQSITVETGVKRPDEVRFLMDMIGSEEVYLLDLTELPLKVIPSVETMTYKPRPETPEKFTIKLEISDSETNIMQEIIDGTEGRKPRVFSKQFSKQFN